MLLTGVLLSSCVLPPDSVEKSQRREGSAHVHGVAQDEAKSPLHALFAPLGHEGRDPQHAAPEALEAPQEALLPLLADQVLEGPLNHRRVHGHQVRLPSHVLGVFLHRSQVTP